MQSQHRSGSRSGAVGKNSGRLKMIVSGNATASVASGMVLSLVPNDDVSRGLPGPQLLEDKANHADTGSPKEGLGIVGTGMVLDIPAKDLDQEEGWDDMSVLLSESQRLIGEKTCKTEQTCIESARNSGGGNKIISEEKTAPDEMLASTGGCTADDVLLGSPKSGGPREHPQRENMPRMSIATEVVKGIIDGVVHDASVATINEPGDIVEEEKRTQSGHIAVQDIPSGGTIPQTKDTQAPRLLSPWDGISSRDEETATRIIQGAGEGTCHEALDSTNGCSRNTGTETRKLEKPTLTSAPEVVKGIIDEVMHDASVATIRAPGDIVEEGETIQRGHNAVQDIPSGGTIPHTKDTQAPRLLSPWDGVSSRDQETGTRIIQGAGEGTCHETLDSTNGSRNAGTDTRKLEQPTLISALGNAAARAGLSGEDRSVQPLFGTCGAIQEYDDESIMQKLTGGHDMYSAVGMDSTPSCNIAIQEPKSTGGTCPPNPMRSTKGRTDFSDKMLKMDEGTGSLAPDDDTLNHLKDSDRHGAVMLHQLAGIPHAIESRHGEQLPRLGEEEDKPVEDYDSPGALQSISEKHHAKIEGPRSGSSTELAEGGGIFGGMFAAASSLQFRIAGLRKRKGVFKASAKRKST
eukprot:gene1462-32839_t